MRFYGNKKWINIDQELRSDKINRFCFNYGDTITLMFDEGTAIHFPVEDIVRETGLEHITPVNRYLEFARTAFEIFFQNSNKLYFDWGKANELEVECVEMNICMIFVEFRAILTKRLHNVNGNMHDYFTKYSSKRIDFRGKTKKKSKRFIQTLFEYPEGSDSSGWPILKKDTNFGNPQNETLEEGLTQVENDTILTNNYINNEP